jgi:thiosulfate dehydrogenase [quinone] large subunit
MLGIKPITKSDGTVVFHDPPIAQFLFGNTKMAVVWLVIRLYVGWSWLEAGLHKLFEVDAKTGEILWGQLNKSWMLSGSGIKGYWERAVAIPAPPARPAITYDWFRDFLEFLLAIQAESWMSKVIVFGEIAVGLGLIAGAFVGVAAFFGAFMNMNFMLAGTTSSNPVLFLLAVFLMLAWKVAGYYGLDRYLLPALGTPWESLRMLRAAPPAAPPAPSAAD